MAIDPNIAMSFRTPQIDNPLDLAMKGMSLQNAGMQQQLDQQAMQQNQYALNRAGRAESDDAADSAAIRANMVQDPQTGKTSLNQAGYLKQLGESAPTLAMTRTQQFATQTLANQKGEAEQKKLDLDNTKNILTIGGQIAGTINDQDSYDRALPQLYKIGAIQPGQAPSQYDPVLVQQFVNRSMTALDHITQKQKQAEIDATAVRDQNNKDWHSDNNGARDAEAQRILGIPAAERTDAESRSLAGYKELQAINNPPKAAGRGMSMPSSAPPTFGQGHDSATGDEFLSTLSPSLRNQVKATANGDIAIAPPGTRSPEAQAIRTAVMNYDPSYTDARYKGKQNFKTSADAQNIVQLATAMEHLESIKRNSQSVGTAPLLSQNATGADARYNDDVKLFAQETGKLVKNGVLTESEYEDLKGGMNSWRQGIRDSSIDERTNLIGGKVSALFQKYKTATGQDLPLNEFFDQPTQQRLKRFRVGQSSGGSSPQGGGSASTQHFTDGSGSYDIPAGQVAEFKKDHPHAR